MFAPGRRWLGLAHEGGDHGRRGEAREEFAGGWVEELLAPIDVVVQHDVELGASTDLHDFLVEFVAGAEAFGIPRRDFAEHATSKFLAKNFHHQIQMTRHDARAFLEGGFGREFAGLAGGLEIAVDGIEDGP